MSDDKKESIADKKVSRRSMLKWTGALAAAAVIGGAAVYGATYKAPPPPPPSFKPPLSADVQTTVDGIVQNMISRHSGESIMFGGCNCNCAGTGCAVPVPREEQRPDRYRTRPRTSSQHGNGRQGYDPAGV